MSLKPLNDRVLVKRLESEERTASGLYIPDTAKEKPSKGEVVAVGPGKHADDGKLVKAQRGGEGGGGNDADKRAGDLRAPFLRPDEHDGDDQRADEDGLEVRVEAEAGVGGELFEVGAALRDGAEEVIDLPERDDDGDAGGEAHDDGHRDEADEPPKLKNTG